MRKFFWVIGGFCAAAIGFLVLYAPRTQNAALLSHHFEDSLVDNHTIVEPV